MTLQEQQKLANHIFRILKVTDISFPIGRTNKGQLEIKFTKDKEDFEIILDAVPLNEKDYDNRELKSIVNKYLFDSEDWPQYNIQSKLKELEELVDDGTMTVVVNSIRKSDFNGNLGEDVTEKMLGKKRGRPVGSKNKPKPVEDKVNG